MICSGWFDITCDGSLLSGISIVLSIFSCSSDIWGVTHIEFALEKKVSCWNFLVVSQPFDEIWYQILTLKNGKITLIELVPVTDVMTSWENFQITTRTSLLIFPTIGSRRPRGRCFFPLLNLFVHCSNPNKREYSTEYVCRRFCNKSYRCSLRTSNWKTSGCL